MKVDELIAIDTHTHAEVSCWNPFDAYGEEYDRAADKYFRSNRRPTIAETVAYYRERNIGLVMFTVDAEIQAGAPAHPQRGDLRGRARQRRHDDRLCQHRPAQGQDGRARGAPADRAARRQGLQVPPHGAGLRALRQDGLADLRGDRRAQAAGDLPQRPLGIGSGMRCGGGLRLRNSNPMLLEDVAIAFPDMQIVVAHPSWPWQDEALSLALHKPNVWIDLSGWSPKYFPPQLVQYANTLLKERMLFGSDYPLITPDRWLEGLRRGRLQGQASSPAS
jgi:hypothetical protein